MAREAAIRQRYAADEGTEASMRSASGFENVAIEAANAMLGISKLSLAEQARAIQAEEIARIQLYGGQASDARSFTEILNTLTARLKFQTPAMVANEKAIEEMGRRLGLVVPGIDTASSSVSGLSSSTTSATTATDGLSSSIENLDLTMSDGISAGDDFLNLMNGIAEVEAGPSVGDMTRELQDMIVELDRADELIRKEGGLFEFMKDGAKVTAEFDEFGNLIRSFTDPGVTPVNTVTGETVDINAINKVFNSEYGSALADFTGGRQQLLDAIGGQMSFVNPETGMTRTIAGQLTDTLIDRVLSEGFEPINAFEGDVQELIDTVTNIGNEVGVDVKLARGGVVTTPMRALVGEAGPEAVIPLSRMNQMTGGTTFNIYVNASNRTGGAQAGEEVVAALKGYNSTNGDFNRALTGFGA